MEVCIDNSVIKNVVGPKLFTRFDCFKSYEESTTFLKGDNAIRFGYLYHYVSLTYLGSERIPKISIDGNYYDIPDPLEAISGDIWKRTTDILINDHELKSQVEAVIGGNDALSVDQFLSDIGFISVNMSMIYGDGIQIVSEPRFHSGE